MLRLILFILSLQAVSLFAAEVQLEEGRLVKITTHAQYWIDSTGKASWSDLPSLEQWQSIPPVKSHYSFGITEHAIWIYVPLRNTSEREQQYVLVSEDSRTDLLDIYVTHHNQIESTWKTGDRRLYESRAIDFRSFATPLTLAAGEGRAVYLRYQSASPLEVDLRLYPQAQFQKTMKTANQIATLYTGAMASIILFNLFLFFTSREKIYLLYCLFQFATLGTLTVAFGNAYGMFWPRSPEFHNAMAILLPSLAPAFALLFMGQYLGVSQGKGWLWKGIVLIASLEIIVGILSLLGTQRWMMKALYSAIFVSAALVLCVPTYRALKRDRTAILFLIAWLPLVVAALLFSFGRLGFDLSLFPQGTELAFGSIWEAVFLSLCLGDKFNQIKKQEITYLERIRREELAMEKAKLEAEALEREQQILAREAKANRNLVRVIVHDLANPLSLIINYASVHRKKEMTWPDAQAILVKIARAADHQAEIIEHVRELEALHSGKLSLSLQAVSLSKVFATVTELLHDRLLDKKVQINLQGLEQDLAVLAEFRSLAYNVIANILSNAIKFSPDGSEINISCRDEESFVLIIIKDQGIGMKADLIANLFDMSKPTSRIGLKGEKGTGFGLPIVKSYLDFYQATIEIKSWAKDEYPDQSGTEMTLRLHKQTLA